MALHRLSTKKEPPFMARVEIEERAWSDPGIKTICVKGGITRAYAIGLLATLWHDSQEKVQLTATDDELNIWFAEDIAKGIDAIGLLEASGYIERTPNGRWKISGNSNRVARVKAYKARGKNANDVRWGKYREQKQNVALSPTRMLEDDPQGIPTCNMQHATCEHATNVSLLRNEPEAKRLGQGSRFGPIFFGSSEKGETEKQNANETTPKSSAKAPTIEERGSPNTSTRQRPKNASRAGIKPVEGTNLVIAHFVDTYQKYYPAKPVIDGLAASAAKRVTQALGVDRSKEYIEAFLLMKDEWFLTKRHGLKVLADNLDAVANFIASNGKQKTGMAVKREAAEAHYDTMLDNYLEKRGLKEKSASNLNEEGEVIDVSPEPPTR